jgi:hypothetical protein
LASGPAVAQSRIVNLPAEKFLIAPGGVDMRTGRYVYQHSDLSIGAGDGALSLERTMPERVGTHANPFSNFSHNWDIFLLETRTNLYSGEPIGSDYRLAVHYGGRAQTFEAGADDSTGTQLAAKSSGPLQYLMARPQDTKASASAIYTYTSADGTEIVFRPIGSLDCADQTWGNSPRRCAYASDMTTPDGTHYSFQYAYNPGGSGNRARLTSVTSSRGYALILEGSGSVVTKACVLNLATAPLPPDGLCPAGAPASASYGYNSGGRLDTVTDAVNKVWHFTYSGETSGGYSIGYLKPGATLPWLTNSMMYRQDEEGAQQEVVLQQNFLDGQVYGYGFNQTPVTDAQPPTIAGGTWTDAANRTTRVTFAFPVKPESGPNQPCYTTHCSTDQPDDFNHWVYQQTEGPVEIVDPLGRRTTFDYCDPAVAAATPGACAVRPLLSFTDPEGIKTELFYDGSGNINKAIRHPKPGQAMPDGSPAPTIVTEAAFDTGKLKAQTKPLWTKDAKGNVTSYTYEAAHGGVLTETLPAVNGVTPQKRYTYEQRSAWLSNGAGGYAPAATPVWLLTRVAFCKTTNPSGWGCAGGASDEMVTTYDYGPNAGPNNLWLRGTVVDAGGLSLRSCYAYDQLGNKVAETSPRGATTGTCP